MSKSEKTNIEGHDKKVHCPTTPKVAKPEVSEAHENFDKEEKDEIVIEEINFLKIQKELKSKDEQIEKYNNELKKEKETRQELFDKYLRLQAEFENFRKRMEREKADFLKYTMENFFKEMLPVIDNFELALESAEKTSDLKGFTEGVKLIHQQFQDILKKGGLAHFTSVGEIFDPTKHEAVMQIASDAYRENTVIEELKKGYYLKDRLIRPALVAVAKNKSDETK